MFSDFYEAMNSIQFEIGAWLIAIHLHEGIYRYRSIFLGKKTKLLKHHKILFQPFNIEDFSC